MQKELKIVFVIDSYFDFFINKTVDALNNFFFMLFLALWICVIVITRFIQLFSIDVLTYTSIFFSRNSEVSASEFRKYLKEIFFLYT